MQGSKNLCSQSSRVPQWNTEKSESQFGVTFGFDSEFFDKHLFEFRIFRTLENTRFSLRYFKTCFPFYPNIYFQLVNCYQVHSEFTKKFIKTLRKPVSFGYFDPICEIWLRNFRQAYFSTPKFSNPNRDFWKKDLNFPNPNFPCPAVRFVPNWG